MTNGGGVRFPYNKEEEENLTPEQVRFKRDVRGRLEEARKKGLPAGKIAKHMKNGSVHTVYDMLDARRFPMSAWEEMDGALKELGI